MLRLFLSTVLCGCLVSLTQAQSSNGGLEYETSEPEVESSEGFQPSFKPTLTVTRAKGVVRVDGQLDEDAWSDVVPISNFSEVFPNEQSRPPVELSGRVMYDDDYLYVGIIVVDDPSQIRANLSDRDEIWQDDYAGIVLDPNRDGQGMYFIAANPLGIQADTFISPNNEDEGFDILFRSGGQITENGYQVEIAIPFKSLRFPSIDEQTWGITLWITRPRESRNQYSWAAIDQDNPCVSCQLGEINGIRGIRAGRNLEILPSLTGGGVGALRDAGEPASGFKNDRMTLEPSLNLKYGITSELTADVTVNPDFSQIESDEAQIDVNSTFALFFQERRPFFQEGSGLFDTDIQTVYTRSINDPIGAAKLTGRFGSVDVAYIGARDNNSPLLLPFEEESRVLEGGRSVSNILRVRHNFNNDSFVGALVTDRRLDEGGSGSTVSVDAAARILQKYTLSGQFVYSNSVESTDEELSKDVGDITFGKKGYTGALDGESFSGYAARVELDRGARYWSFEGGYEAISPTFRADNGFVRQNNDQSAYLWQGVTIYPEKVLGFVDRIRPNVLVGSSWNFDGLQKNFFFRSAVFVQLKRQTNVQINWWYREENFAGTQFDGMTRLNAMVFSNFSKRISLGVEAGLGESIARFLDEPEIGNSLEVSAWGTLRPTQRMSIQPQFSYSRLSDKETSEEFFSGYIARTRVKYQFTRHFFLRTIVQYSDFSKSLEIDPLLTYKINAFTALHVGSTHDFDQFSRPQGAEKYFRQSSRQIFFKVQYLFRT
ncbi:MAG: carbohydrate binding family 9 domain-containing protein [Rhodothermaceae bacterium]|nr:carbohydrate binding family 9 domain-containing protein [Rhodothermaceae bacterium]MYB91520.1 carbohydrate binding family 9 domain-containing protein [Rhodothermaceae bacterium]MYD69065.1 carbohydrate binding family 9 domain-containing protein [Rhodothermaceae bacterium]MYG43631.1 carbohydrate binding family 9 domain-containing protein [Rhodothermaceae bacterium]MYJ07166.1 carbohydrate binding family 9 domain-containing protein [Rhodothermaceae bacterium]